MSETPAAMFLTPIPASTAPVDLRHKLSEAFGFRRFRPGQRRAAEAALSGRDTLVIMPTGSGKSLCFQLPALLLEGTTVVVSPLIALMKDQADALRGNGLKVAELNSAMSARDQQEALEELREGRLEFLYTTPERLARPEFLEVLRGVRIDLFVVDEAHCISHWGHDFRPDYLNLADAVEAIGRPPVLALTATATSDVVDDILRRLRMEDAEVVHTGFYRPNLFLEVQSVAGTGDKVNRIRRFLEESAGTGIIYSATVKAVMELTEELRGAGLRVSGYHGRMKARDRAESQDRFMSGEVRAMVATNAFGLGIDKPDIRFVVHHHIPGILEAYYQEAGRGGRDGQPARCVLLDDPADRPLQKFLHGKRFPDVDELVNTHHTLKRVEAAGATFDQLKALAPLRPTRLRQALQVLKERGLASRGPDGVYRVVVADCTVDDFHRLADEQRERLERDRLKLKQMVDYAAATGCRWRALLDAFEDDALDGAGCGHCDRCVPETIRAAG